MKENQNEKIKDILDDLYAIDPVLEHYEEEIKKTIKELLKSKPNIKIDQKFVSELREKIIKRVEELQVETKIKKPAFWQSFFGVRFAYGFSGALVLMIFVSLIFGLINNVNVPGISGPGISKKTDLGDNAFGSLVADNSQQSTVLEAGRSFAGYGGGGGVQLSTAMDASEKAIAPYPYYPPRYVYKGEEVALEESTIEVLRRKNKIEYTRSFSGLLESFGFGLADLGGFDNTRIQTINLVQEKDFGYSVFINFDEGSISIDAYWPKWPNQQSGICKGDVCVMQNENWPTLTAADIPADEELISITDRFISEHKINLSGYGEPEIDKSWNRVYYYGPGQEASQAYVPDVITVKYPLVINGSFVYEQGGYKLGITVNVNIRHKKVSGLYNLSVQEYESSLYEAETDFSKILKAAEKGGLYNYFMSYEETKEFEIGTPEKAYSVIWKYDQSSQTSRTLLVPALVFPVNTTPDTEMYYYNDKIVIPLAKELLESVDYPMPVPLMESVSPEARDNN